MKTHGATNGMLHGQPLRAFGLALAIVIGVIVGLFCGLSLIFTVLEIVT
jgi:hypothetical protein